MANPSSRRRSATDKLESTTTMSSVSSEPVPDAGQQATALLSEAGKAGAAGRKASRRTAQALAAPPAEITTSAEPPVGPTPDLEATERVGGPGLVDHAVTEITEPLSALAPTPVEAIVSTVETVSAPMAEIATGVDLPSAAPVAEPANKPANDPVAWADLNARLAEAMHANIEETLAFFTSLLDVRSVSEATALNARHVRRQLEAFATQSRDVTLLARNLALETLGTFLPRDTATRR